MIRPATHADIAVLLILSEQMHAESRYRSLPFNPGKMADLLASLMDGADGCVLVAEVDGHVVGCFAGWCAPHFFSDARVASDFGLYLDPEHRRSGLAAALLRGFVVWAHERGAVLVDAGVTTGTRLDATTRLYRSLGFEPVGTVFEFKGG